MKLNQTSGTTLVITACHGSCTNPCDALNPACWQKDFDYPEEPPLLVEHCQVAVALAGITNSHLVISGGLTRVNEQSISEARSYMRIAEAHGFWGFPQVKDRVVLEEHAADSLGNIILSMGAAYHICGSLPTRVIAVGYSFKAERFAVHAGALGLADANIEFFYAGLNNPPKARGVLDLARQGEAKKLADLKLDPLLLGPEWVEQRRKRNPYDRPPYDFYHLGPNREFEPFLEFLYKGSTKNPPPWI